jgi:hypothetical protein
VPVKTFLFLLLRILCIRAELPLSPSFNPQSVMSSVHSKAARADVLRTDADIDNWDSVCIDKLLPLQAGMLKRAVFTSPHNRFPVTNPVVRPFFQLYRPVWDSVPLPPRSFHLS